MKQYTTPEQTAKLIELGFEKPKFVRGYRQGETRRIITSFGVLETTNDVSRPILDYSIGELLNILPNTFTRQGVVYALSVSGGNAICSSIGCSWSIYYIPNANVDVIGCTRDELIDALYSLIIKLKKIDVL